MPVLYKNQSENYYRKLKNILYLNKKSHIYFHKEKELGSIVYYIYLLGSSDIYYLTYFNFIRLIKFCINHNITFTFSKCED